MTSSVMPERTPGCHPTHSSRDTRLLPETVSRYGVVGGFAVAPRLNAPSAPAPPRPPRGGGPGGGGVLGAVGAFAADEPPPQAARKTSVVAAATRQTIVRPERHIVL